MVQMQLHYYTDDGDIFLFGCVVFAKEIKTIFVTDINGFNFHSFAEQSEFYDIDELENKDHHLKRETLNDILLKMCPAYSVISHGHDELGLAIEPALMQLFPSLVVNNIYPFTTQGESRCGSTRLSINNLLLCRLFSGYPLYL